MHAEDVLHRDIKPGNVFVRRRDGQPVLLDFGAAKADFSKHSRSRAPHTPGYAAPEQVEDAGHLGPWTDVYAVGALMWRVATGSAPPVSPAPEAAPAREATPPRPVSERAVGTVFRDALKDGGEGPEMVVLTPGRFRMGSPSGEEGRWCDEGPVRTVTISRPIAMGRYEVTFAEYDRFVSATGRERG